MPRIANSTRVTRAIERLRKLSIELLNYDVQITLIPLGPPKKKEQRPKKDEAEEYFEKYDRALRGEQ